MNKISLCFLTLLFVACFSMTRAESRDCPQPTDIQVIAASNMARLNWSGECESYNLRYRITAQTQYSFFDGFEDGLDNWTVYTEGEGAGWHAYDPSNFSGNAWAAHSGNYTAMTRSWNPGALNADNWLITPQLALEGTLHFWVIDDGTWHETYHVCVSTTGNAIEDFELLYTPGDATDSWTEVTVDLSAFNGQQGYLALHHVDYNKDFLLIDDFGIVTGELQPTDWITVTTTETFAEISNLEANTTYEYQIQGVCGDLTSEWTTIANFTTLSEGKMLFVNDGNWNDENNWLPAGIPTADNDVFILADAIIPAGVVAEAGNTTIEGGSITIKDGGQLYQNTESLQAAVEKEIVAYTGYNDHYYFISSPLKNTTYIGNYPGYPHVSNLLNGSYDFYRFNASYKDAEWRNYRTTAFNMSSGNGYLYANSSNQTLVFTGPVWASRNQQLTLPMPFDSHSTAPFIGWTLVGNPFVCNGYLCYTDLNGNPYEADFYVMNEAGNNIELASSSTVTLSPCEGAFVQYGASGYLKFLTENPFDKGSRSSLLNLTLTQGRAKLDMARIRFGEGQNLGKFCFRDNLSKLYIPMDGTDYAVVYSEGMGEVPVSFKAESNGTYTLSFTAEEVSFNYLHLIDNMTGTDIDLLQTPSYSFEARTTDYASRFKLVFCTGNAVEDNFAFYTNGSFVINNEGNATLQVIDVTGRILKSEGINGSAIIGTNDLSAGVYVMRLSNGNDVKVQKVVVR